MSDEISKLNVDLARLFLRAEEENHAFLDNAKIRMQNAEIQRIQDKVFDLKSFENLTSQDSETIENILDEAENKIMKVIKKNLLKIDENYDDEQQLNIAQSNNYSKIISDFSKNGGTGFYDVLINLQAAYSPSTDLLKELVNDMKEKGNDIHVIHEKYTGRDKKEGYGAHDTEFVIVMPSSCYAEFNTRLHEKNEKTNKEINIAKFNEVIMLPQLTETPSLDTLKDIAKSYENDREVRKKYDDIVDVFREQVTVGTLRLAGNNNDSENKLNISLRHLFKDIYKRDTQDNSIHFASKGYKDTELAQELDLVGKRVSLSGQASILLKETDSYVIELLLKEKEKLGNVRKINIKRPKQ